VGAEDAGWERDAVHAEVASGAARRLGEAMSICGCLRGHDASVSIIIVGSSSMVGVYGR
jgi:hypothetical protein